MYMLFSAPIILINNHNGPISNFLDDFFFMNWRDWYMASYTYLESQCLKALIKSLRFIAHRSCKVANFHTFNPDRWPWKLISCWHDIGVSNDGSSWSIVAPSSPLSLARARHGNQMITQLNRLGFEPLAKQPALEKYYVRRGNKPNARDRTRKRNYRVSQCMRKPKVCRVTLGFRMHRTDTGQLNFGLRSKLRGLQGWSVARLKGGWHICQMLIQPIVWPCHITNAG